MNSISGQIVTDGRTLRAAANKYGITYDKTYKYITHERSGFGPFSNVYRIAGKEYKTRYFDGCFYPYLVTM